MYFLNASTELHDGCQRGSISFAKLDHRRVLSCSQVNTTLIWYFDQVFFIARNYQTFANGWRLIITNCYWFPPCFLLTITDYYLLLMIITDYYWLLLIMIINVDFTPNYDLSITWFSLLPNISNDLSSPHEQEEMQNHLVLHLLCFPTGRWLKFSEPDLQMKFSGLGLQLNIFGPGRLRQRLSGLWDKLLLLGIGLKTLMKV